MMMRGGTVAVLGLKIWTKTKHTRRTAANTKSAMMRPSPHCDMSVMPRDTVDERATYGVCQASPLESQQQTDGTGKQRCSSENVQLENLAQKRKTGLRSVGNLERISDDGHRHAAERQVDVEAPPPGDLGSEGPAEQRADDGRQAEDGAEEALVQRPLVQGHRVDDDDDDAGHDAGGPEPGDGPTDDEGDGARRRAADGGADLEEEDGGKEAGLDAEEGVELAEVQLEGTVGE